jgi:toxin ParE1/3/4
MIIEWSEFAISDRNAIFDYIEADSLRTAVAVDSRIEKATDRLARFPESGRPGRVDGTRELVIVATPYVVAYRVRRSTVRILRILHGAQLWPEEIA